MVKVWSYRWTSVRFLNSFILLQIRFFLSLTRFFRCVFFFSWMVRCYFFSKYLLFPQWPLSKFPLFVPQSAMKGIQGFGESKTQGVKLCKPSCVGQRLEGEKKRKHSRQKLRLWKLTSFVSLRLKELLIHMRTFWFTSLASLYSYRLIGTSL